MRWCDSDEGGRDLEMWKPGEQSGAMAVVLVEDVDLKQGAVISIQKRQGMGTIK